MSGDARPPRWPTALVVIGTLSVVALVLVTIGLRSSVPPRSDSVAATPTATPTATSTATPSGTSSAPSSDAPGGASPDARATPTGDPQTSRAPDLLTPTPATSEVDVLNQTFTEGLAGRAAVVVGQRGWPVEQVGNATLGTPATTLYVPAGLEAEGESFVLAFPEVARVRPAFEGLATDRLTLVLAEPDALAVVAAMEAAAGPVS